MTIPASDRAALRLAAPLRAVVGEDWAYFDEDRVCHRLALRYVPRAVACLRRATPWDYRTVHVYRGDRLLGVMPVAAYVEGGERVLSSLPPEWPGGLFTVDDEPWDDAELVRAISRDVGFDRLVYHTPFADRRIPGASAPDPRVRERWIAPVPDPDTFLARLAPATRRALRKAAHSGCEVTFHPGADGIARFLDVYRPFCLAESGQSGHRVEHFETLAEVYGDDLWIHLVWRGGRVVAGSLVLRTDRVASEAFRASLPDERDARPSDALMGALFPRLHAAGVEHFALGYSDVRRPGQGRFKAKYLAEPVVYPRLEVRDTRLRRLG